GYRADHPPETAGRVSAERVPAEARHARRGGTAPRNEKVHRHRLPLLLRLVMNYPDSVQFLYSLGNETKTAKLGLERIRALLEALGNPHQRGRFVHVAGTNGKGSVCAMVESGLRAAGARTGLFTSPHLVEPVERIRINGQPVSTSEFASAFDQVHAAAEELIERGTIDLHPTYFETVTAMGFVLFAARECDR